MKIACIDMEGVLIPELWPLIAEATGIQELKITTREWPDYRSLVDKRIELLNQHHIRLTDLHCLLRTIKPLPGALWFLEQLRVAYRIVIVSDAFREMIEPLWLELGAPELRCHHFICNSFGSITHAHYSREQGKHEVIEEFKANGYRTIAVGDAFNDLSMLRMADDGFLFSPSNDTLQTAGGLKVVYKHEDILRYLGLT
jgi:phosphoserine/homoserine phosphotransferase